jgi:hypothetical protein
MVQELGSYAEGSGDPTTQTSTPKSMEEVVIEVMKTNKIAELFHTITIMSLHMGNFILEASTLKHKLAIGEKAML